MRVNKKRINKKWMLPSCGRNATTQLNREPSSCEAIKSEFKSKGFIYLFNMHMFITMHFSIYVFFFPLSCFFVSAGVKLL